jgi:pyridoxal phosphate enzyme (YggS family)
MIDEGQRDFGESRPQQLRDRAQRWPQCCWHMIGSLQKNKAKYIARHAAYWHSLCDVTTAEAVAKHVVGRRLPVFIQVNVSAEAQKHGVHPSQVPALITAVEKIPHLQLIGLMGMAAKDGDPTITFRTLRQCRDAQTVMMKELSMGMSQDWQAAITEGATMVRLGSMLFNHSDTGV